MPLVKFSIWPFSENDQCPETNGALLATSMGSPGDARRAAATSACACTPTNAPARPGCSHIGIVVRYRHGCGVPASYQTTPKPSGLSSPLSWYCGFCAWRTSVCDASRRGSETAIDGPTYARWRHIRPSDHHASRAQRKPAKIWRRIG